MEHATHDRFDVLVIDRDALQSIDLLDFVQEVLLDGFFARDTQDVVGNQRTVDERLQSAPWNTVDGKHYRASSVYAVARKMLAEGYEWSDTLKSPGIARQTLPAQAGRPFTLHPVQAGGSERDRSAANVLTTASLLRLAGVASCRRNVCPLRGI